MPYIHFHTDYMHILREYYPLNRLQEMKQNTASKQ